MQNHLFIDYENCQPALDEVVNNHLYGGLHIWLILGAAHVKVPTKLLLQLKSLGKRGHVFQAQASGKNALDFHIAYLIGKLQHNSTRENPCRYFVCSRDKGFDSLLRFVTEKDAPRRGFAQRIETLDELKIHFMTEKKKPPCKKWLNPICGKSALGR